jgi:uncharacterized protein YndB with AHSA1/START domain
MTDSPLPAGELVFVRVFDAPRELVFRCMIEPEHLTHFWAQQASAHQCRTSRSSRDLAGSSKR